MLLRVVIRIRLLKSSSKSTYPVYTQMKSSSVEFEHDFKLCVNGVYFSIWSHMTFTLDL